MAIDDDTVKPQRGRSKAYPVISLGEALEKIKKINDNLGVNGQFNRESLAAGMGYISLNGTSGRRIAALVQYGFLNRTRDLYFLSDLAKKYLLPISDNDQADVIQEAALAPPLFSDIYEAFNGQVLPKQFVNRLIQEFGIEQKAASDVERIFKATMETAGILQANGILKNGTVSSMESAGVDSRIQSLNQPSGSGQLSSNIAAPMDHLSVKLPSGLIVSYPQNLASAFAFGSFGSQLKALDDIVSKYIDDNPAKNEGEV